MHREIERSGRRRFLLGIAGLSVGSGVPLRAAWAARGLQHGEAINQAGRLRMLSQRVAKAYCQIGLGILPERSTKILQESRRQFSEHLADLLVYAPTAEIKKTYVALDNLWRQYLGLTSGRPDRDKARRIAGINEEVLRLAHQGTIQLERHTSTSLGHLINLAGRQRMLSQRMAKFYMLHLWDIRSATLEQETDLARREFMSAQESLEQAPENNRVINEELTLARMQWLFIDQALNERDTVGNYTKIHATNVATTSERLLEVMDRVTDYYARLDVASPRKG